MGISPRTIEFLIELGHDATHLFALGLEEMQDSEVLQMARVEGRVLLAHDLDFGELLAASGERFPSVIIFRLRNMRPDSVNLYLRMALDNFHDDLETGSIISVSERSIRARSLPAQRSE